MPLVLVHNDVVAPEYQWDDVEGVHYHYPSKYRGKVRLGEPFVYYRGVHRINGSRGPAEYVGPRLIEGPGHRRTRDQDRRVSPLSRTLAETDQ